MRKAIVDYEKGNPIEISAGHVHHCLDALRQDTTCNADDTPMPSKYSIRVVSAKKYDVNAAI